MEDRFETCNTGRGSKTHKEHLRKKILSGIHILKLKEMSLTELEDRAEELLAENEHEKNREELLAIKEYLDAYIKISKEQQES